MDRCRDVLEAAAFYLLCAGKKKKEREEVAQRRRPSVKPAARWASFLHPSIQTPAASAHLLFVCNLVARRKDRQTDRQAGTEGLMECGSLVGRTAELEEFFFSSAKKKKKKTHLEIFPVLSLCLLDSR